MFQRITVMCIVVFSLLACVTPQGCFADAVEVLEQAKAYKNSGNQQLAQQTYNTVAASYPGSGYALTAKSEITIMSISAKTDSQVQAEINSLKAEFSGNANLPAALCNIAAGYAWAGKYQQGADLYQQIIQDYPASGDVAKAQVGSSRINALSSIKSGDYATAAAEVANLINNYSGSEYLPETLYHIARRYQWSRQYEQATSIHQEIIQRFPDSSEADRARLDVGRIKVLSLIKSGDCAAAEAETNKLLQELSAHPGLPVVLHSIAREYERKAKYTEAAALHQQVIQQYPDNARAERARFDFAKTSVLLLIQAGSYTTAAAELDKFSTDFGHHPLFTRAMVPIGEQYYEQGCLKESQGEQSLANELYQKAIAAWGHVRQQSQSYEFSPAAWYFSAHCYRKLTNYEKVIECCEKTLADWPNYQYAGEAQYLIGFSFEKLAQAGIIPQAEAEPKIKSAYQQLVENYPECEPASYAQDWLNQHNCE